jgi:hypothetical protein
VKPTSSVSNGPEGRQGPRGSDGPTGTTGINGLEGWTGHTGPRGSAGAFGFPAPYKLIATPSINFDLTQFGQNLTSTTFPLYYGLKKVAISGSGQYQSIASYYTILRSADYGVTWTDVNTGVTDPYWQSIAMSESGEIQTAVRYSQIYQSTDYGVSWTLLQTFSDVSFTNVEMSASGQYQTAVAGADYIYRSSDFGSTWSSVGPIKEWTNIAVSGSGQYQTATTANEYAYVSNDYGLTWVAKLNDAVRSLLGVSMSGSGQYQTIVEQGGTATSLFYNGKIHVSTDYGNTWSQKSVLGDWYNVAISASGQYQIAVGDINEVGTQLYRSIDYGNTWVNILVTKPQPGILNSVDISSSGQYMSVTQSNENILYAFNNPYNTYYDVEWSIQ